MAVERNRVEVEMDEDDDFGSDDDWDEMDDNHHSTVDCLFCVNEFHNIDSAVTHCFKDHGFDLSKLKARHKMDCYSYIKLVNFVRTTKPGCDTIMSCEHPTWADDKYLAPVNNEDPWLMFDFDDVEEPTVLASRDALPRTGYPVNAEDGRVTLSETHFAELQRTIQTLNAQVEYMNVKKIPPDDGIFIPKHVVDNHCFKELFDKMKEKDIALGELFANMEQMKSLLGGLVVGEKSGGSILTNKVSDLSLDDDQEYFNSYSNYSIHHEMLSDVVRTESYRDALLNNKAVMAGCKVLDLGCGTGILSLFAAQAGAAQVIGIDQSDIVYNAMDTVRENGLHQQVTLLKGRLEDTELPVQQVDVIVSEWMGYFLLFEAMLDSVIYARDHHLRPGGLMLPNRCSLSLFGANDLALRSELLDFWSNVYGFKMSSLRHNVVQEPVTRVVSPDCIVTTPAQLCHLDLMTVTTDCIDFESEFQFVASKDTEINALIGYFDVFFDLPNAVSFSTSPFNKPTHWKQTIFLVQKPFPAEKGEVIKGKISCRRNPKNVRGLIVLISLNSATSTMSQRYLLS